VAIAAVQNSSIDRLFRNRAIDYFSESYDEQVTARVLGLLSLDAHDLLVVYHQEYDDQLHKTHPFSDQCRQALSNHIHSLHELATACRVAWTRHRYAVVMAPDHGGHLDEATGYGDHGLNIPEDMAVSHWYGLYGLPIRLGIESVLPAQKSITDSMRRSKTFSTFRREFGQVSGNIVCRQTGCKCHDSQSPS
jgi:hypothetical protein